MMFNLGLNRMTFLSVFRIVKYDVQFRSKPYDLICVQDCKI